MLPVRNEHLESWLNIYVLEMGFLNLHAHVVHRNVAWGSAYRVLVRGPHFADEWAAWLKLADLDQETG